MATDLHPTKTRLQLLRDVRDGLVVEGLTEETEGHVWCTADAQYGVPARKVTARVHELEGAGWVECAENLVDWRLTDTGQTVLDGADG